MVAEAGREFPGWRFDAVLDADTAGLTRGGHPGGKGGFRGEGRRTEWLENEGGNGVVSAWQKGQIME